LPVFGLPIRATVNVGSSWVVDMAQLLVNRPADSIPRIWRVQFLP